MKFIQANLLSFLALFALIATSVILSSELPAEIPSRFALDGELLASRPKELMLIVMPAAFLGLMISINVLIRISPRKFSMPNSKRAMDIIVFGTGLLFAFLHYGMLMNQGEYTFFLHYFSIGMAAFLIVTGNVFGKTERNFFLGIYLPWTINSDANWRATHRLCGKLMVISGTTLLLTSFFLTSVWLLLGLALSPLAIASIYSFIYYQTHEKQSEPDEADSNEPETS
ncbi:MAG: SdpI family protein [Gammaproteobacteria bacterium]